MANMYKRILLLFCFYASNVSAQAVFDHVLLIGATGSGISTEQTDRQLAFMQDFFYTGLGLDNRNLTVVKGADATKANIIAALQRLKQVPKQDRVFIYMLGTSYTFDTEAGYPRGFFIPSDFNLNEILQDARMFKGNLVRDAVPYLSIRDMISTMASPQVSLILDTNAAGLGDSYPLSLPSNTALPQGHGILYLNGNRESSPQFENGLTLFSQHLVHIFEECTQSLKPSDIHQAFQQVYKPAQVRAYGLTDITDISYPCAVKKVLNKRPSLDTEALTTSPLLLSNLSQGATVWLDNAALKANSAGEYPVENREQVVFITKPGIETTRFFLHPQRGTVLQRTVSNAQISAHIALDASISGSYQVFINNVRQERLTTGVFPVVKGENYIKLQDGATIFLKGFEAKPGENYTATLVKNAPSSAKFVKNLLLPVGAQVKNKSYLMGIMIGTSVLGAFLWQKERNAFAAERLKYDEAVRNYQQALNETDAVAAYNAYSTSYKALKSHLNKQRIGQGLLGAGILTHVLDSFIHSKLSLTLKISKR
jgi:hypothetical protein